MSAPDIADRLDEIRARADALENERKCNERANRPAVATICAMELDLILADLEGRA